MQAGEAIEEIIKAVEAVLAEGGLNPQQLTFVNTIHQNSKHLYTLNSTLPTLESALRQILPNISHDIKAPLMSMRGYSQLLTEHPEQFGGTLSPKQQESLRFISRQAEALGNWYQIIRESGLEEMKQQHQALPQACDLSEILRHCEVFLQFDFQQAKRPVQLSVFMPENLPPTFAASYHLAQLIIHIVNVMAFELIEYGKIQISAGSDGTLVNLRIFCTGIGSTTAEIHSLFEKEGRHAYRKRFEQQGGRIEFSREAGVGAAVHLLIAIAKN
jgi:light-regulated signal transduction histidine kinase (bacteriophytochrome)